MTQTARFTVPFVSLTGLFVVLASFAGQPWNEVNFWVASVLLIWATVRAPIQRGRFPGWATSGADFAAAWSLLWLTAYTVSGAIHQDVFQNTSEIALIAGAEESIFRFAPLVFFAALPPAWRRLTVVGVSVIIFTALHLPAWDSLMLDKVIFAAAALALLHLSHQLLWPTLLHVCSNLLWKALGAGAAQDATAFIVADIGLAGGSVAIAYLLIRTPLKHSKEILIP